MIEDKNYSLFYQQLSEDWRNRDRMTWQMLDLLVVIGGALIITCFYFLDGKPEIKNTVLFIGLLFSWVSTIFITRNIYLQYVGQSLMNDMIQAIEDNDKTNLDLIIKCSRRIPLHTSAFGVGRHLYLDIFTPFSSLFLLLLSSLLVGIFVQLLCSSCNNNIFGLIGGIIVSIANIFLVFFLSHKYLNNEEIVGARDSKYKKRLVAFALLIPVIAILVAYSLIVVKIW